MKVKINGIGLVDFPDNMSESEIKSALVANFTPKKDDSLEKIMQQIVNLLKTQKPTVVTETKIQQVEKPVIVKEYEKIEVEKAVQSKPSSWKFTIYREDDEISEIIAEPING